MRKIILEFDVDWVRGCSTARDLPTELAASFTAANGFGVVKTKSLTEVVIHSEVDSDEAVARFCHALLTHIAQMYGQPLSDIAPHLSFTSTQLSDAESRLDQLKKVVPEAEFLPKLPLSDSDEPTVFIPPSTMDKIRALHGAEPFVALCEEISRLAPLLAHIPSVTSLRSVLTSVSYLFSIDRGYGLTTAVDLLACLLSETGLLPGTNAPHTLVPDPPGGNTTPLALAVKNLARHKSRVVCVDISNWLDHLTTPEFRDFLLTLQKSAGDSVFIFRLPYLEHSVLRGIEAALSDVMRVRTVPFAPLTSAQLQLISAEKLRLKGFTASDDAWEQFQLRLSEEKSDGRFYGINTAENIIDEMIYLKLHSILNGTSREDTVIEGEELSLLTASSEEYVSAEEKLSRLIGIEKIRDRIFEIISQIEFARSTPGLSAPAMHMRFIGNPGTGKTTVARIVGQLLKERGILSKGYFFERTGSDFIGMYVGHTAPKTLALCRDAYGSVLFIDEAYTLANANRTNGSNFSKEAVDTLISQMENHRDDMVVIMAGYPREMDELLKMNPGLAGRIPYELNFPNYTRDELGRIFLSMVEKSPFTLSPEAEKAAMSYFASLDQQIISADHFANARFVRNLFERTWSKTVTRCQLDGGDNRIIAAADFTAAAAETVEALNARQPPRSKPGYHLV